MNSSFFKKNKRVTVTLGQLEEMDLFYKMLLKMQKNRPNFDTERVMKLLYTETDYRIFKNYGII